MQHQSNSIYNPRETIPVINSNRATFWFGDGPFRYSQSTQCVFNYKKVWKYYRWMARNSQSEWVAVMSQPWYLNTNIADTQYIKKTHIPKYPHSLSVIRGFRAALISINLTRHCSVNLWFNGPYYNGFWLCSKITAKPLNSVYYLFDAKCEKEETMTDSMAI